MLTNITVGWDFKKASVTIANTETDSSLLLCRGWRSGRIFIPDDVTVAYFALLGICEEGDTPGPVNDGAGNPILIPSTGTFVAGGNYPIDPVAFEGVLALQFVSSVAQGADRTFKIGLT